MDLNFDKLNEKFTAKAKKIIKEGGDITCTFRFPDGEEVPAIINKDGIKIDNEIGTARVMADLNQKFGD